jgi:hypothetical protein
MAAAAVPRLGYMPKLCLARPMLFAALECHDRGDVIGAGVRLREAVLRFLKAAADWYGVALPKAKFPEPINYIRALRKSKSCDKWGARIMLDAIEQGNKLAHCQRVEVSCIESSIALMFALMDGEPYCPFERKPVVTSRQTDGYDVDDCGDDDGADWWKSEGGAV